MNLGLADLRALPLASALFDAHGDVVACTPEWRGAGPGAAAYPVRRSRLVVCVDTAAPSCAALLERLLDELDAAAMAVAAPWSLRLRMLAASLRLVAGRSVAAEGGTSDDVLQLAAAGIEARTALRLDIERGDARPVRAPEAAALILVQLAVNAERHAGVDAVTVTQAGNAVHVRWRGGIRGAHVATARRHDERERWGLGFARIAADAIGAVVHAPYTDGGVTSATLEFGVGRLALPLAAVREGRVLRATRTWDEETRLGPGADVSVDPRATAALRAAQDAGGAIARSGGWSARAARGLVWIAIRPDDVADRARDVIDGLAHERALTDGVEEPRRARIGALGHLLGRLLGTPIQRVPAPAWVRRMRELAGPFRLDMSIPDFAGVGATDPSVCALLAAEVGERFEVDGDSLWLTVRPWAARDPLLSPLARADGGRVALS